MPSKLLNLRLDPEDQVLVTRLRAKGISISDVMRRALRAEAAKATNEPIDPSAILAEIMQKIPTPMRNGAVGSRVDATDRHAVREHVVRRLKRRR